MTFRQTALALLVGTIVPTVCAQTPPKTTGITNSPRSTLIRTRSCKIATTQKVPVGDQSMYYTLSVVTFGSPAAVKPMIRNIDIEFIAGTSSITPSITSVKDTELDGMIDALEQITEAMGSKYEPIVLKVADHDFPTADELGFITADHFRVDYAMGQQLLTLEPRDGVTYNFSKDDVATLLGHLKMARAVLAKM